AKELRAARKAAAQAVALDPDGARPLFAEGVVSLAQGDPARAARSLAKALLRSPRALPYLLPHLEEAARRLKTPKDLLAACEPFLGREAKDVPVRLALARLLLKSDPQAALRQVEEARRLAPEHPEALRLTFALALSQDDPMVWQAALREGASAAAMTSEP